MIRCILMMSCLAVLAGCASSPRTNAQNLTPQRQTELAEQQVIIGTKMLKDGNYAEAEKHLTKAIEADAFSGMAHNNLGMVFYHQGRLYEAAWQFQYASKLLPSYPEPRNNLGLVLEETNKLDDAVDQYKGALSLQPDNAQVLGNLARARVRRGDRDEQTRQLLLDLISKDTRARWRQWAQRELMLWPPTVTSEPSPN